LSATARVIPGDGGVDHLRGLGRESAVIAEHLDPDPLLVERIELAPDIEAQEAHQVADLGLGPFPILGRESVEGEAFDAGLARRSEHLAGGLGALAVAGGAGKPPRLRPAAVAVHDDGDVARNRRARISGGRLRLEAGRRLAHF
jgi:hypothetical protein